jgi:hypothetical protein
MHKNKLIQLDLSIIMKEKDLGEYFEKNKN